MSKQVKVIGLDNLDKFKGKIDENLETKANKSDIPESLPANGGDALTAERLKTPRKINGVDFDGSADIEIDTVTSEGLEELKYLLMKIDTDMDVYGVEVDFENNIFTRLSGATSEMSFFNGYEKINALKGRRRCNITSDGTVIAYYGDKNYTEDVFADGTKEVVIYNMVEQPKFYYKVIPLKIEKIAVESPYDENTKVIRKARYYISDTKKPGFKVHPAFVRDGVEHDKIYLASYEGGIFDKDNNSIIDPKLAKQNGKLAIQAIIGGAPPEYIESLKKFTVTSTNSPNYPIIGDRTNLLTREDCVFYAQAIGEGWGISTIQTISVTQLLMLIEYASFNMQASIGVGNTQFTFNNSVVVGAGTTKDLGNYSGKGSKINAGGVDIQCISYRGEENFYGNTNSYIDNIGYVFDTTRSFSPYIVIADHALFEDTYLSSSYEDTGIFIPRSGDLPISAFGYSENYDWAFIPVEGKGNTALPVGDNYSYNCSTASSLQSPDNVNKGSPVQIGGASFYSYSAGAFYLRICNTDTTAGLTGCRLVYIPQTT